VKTGKKYRNDRVPFLADFTVFFFIKTDLSATEKLLLQKAYGNEALNPSKFLGGILDFETEGIW
jgi:hypothetical protein